MLEKLIDVSKQDQNEHSNRSDSNSSKTLNIVRSF